MPFISLPPQQMPNIRLSRTPQHDTNVTWLHFVLCYVPRRTIEIRILTTNKGVCSIHSFSIFRRFNPHNPTRVWMENNPSSHTSFCRISTYFMCSVCLGFLFSFLQVCTFFSRRLDAICHTCSSFLSGQVLTLKGWFAQNNDERWGFKQQLRRRKKRHNRWWWFQDTKGLENDVNCVFYLMQIASGVAAEVWIGLFLAPMQNWWMV